MEKPVVLFVIKVALIIAGIGSLLRLVFFENWLGVFSTFVYLFLLWTLLLLIGTILIRRYFIEFYNLLFPLPSEKELAEKGMSMENRDRVSRDNIDPDEIYMGNQAEAGRLREPAQDGSSPSKTKKPKMKHTRKKTISEPLKSRELEQIKQFDSKDIAKAVKMMMGPDEDNPLLTDKDNRNR